MKTLLATLLLIPCMAYAQGAVPTVASGPNAAEYNRVQAEIAARKKKEEEAAAIAKERASWEKISGRVFWVSGREMLVSYLTGSMASSGIGTGPGYTQHVVHVTGYPDTQRVVQQNIWILGKRYGDYSYTGIDGGNRSVPNYIFMSEDNLKPTPTPNAFGDRSKMKGSSLGGPSLHSALDHK